MTAQPPRSLRRLPYPRSLIELLSEVLDFIKARGTPRQAVEVDRLVIRPMLRALYCATACVIVSLLVTGAIVTAVLLRGSGIQVGSASPKIAAGWLISGASLLTLGSTFAFRGYRRWRSPQPPGPRQRTSTSTASPRGSPTAAGKGRRTTKSIKRAHRRTPPPSRPRQRPMGRRSPPPTDK